MDHESVREWLLKKREELLARGSEIEEKLSDPGNADWEENATEMEDDEVRAGIGELTKQELREVDTALQRLEAGEYGKCIHCSQPIGADRLELLPFTMTCIQCASRG